MGRHPSGDREGGGAGRSGSPQVRLSGDREGGGAGRSGSPQVRLRSLRWSRGLLTQTATRSSLGK
ncbi:hypothetical protein BST12_23620 [Mycobacterium angelicum]|uniref:Uncharacterized protein n=1 Tax=Mycobacterium angelicum TaxID=470074 RepID=A0A1W9ZFI6_MYCAN|nr:hypothetical protein BST12_23620 [Mycobacterium angelicum]